MSGRGGGRPGRMDRLLQNVLKVGSIRSIIILSFTAVAILSMLILSVALYRMFSVSAESNAASSSQQILEQVNLNLDNYLNGMTEISDVIGANLEGEAYKDRDNLVTLLRNTAAIRKDIKTMAVYRSDGSLYLSEPFGGYDTSFAASEQEWFQRAAARPGSSVFQPPHVQRMFENSRPWVVSLCRGIAVRGEHGPETWVIAVDMNFRSIEQLCSKVSLGKRGYIYIVDGSGNIIYHPQQQLIYLKLKNEDIENALKRRTGPYFSNLGGERRLMTVKEMGLTGWLIVGISYVDELVQNQKTFGNSILVIVLFGIAFEAVASLFISARISRPIRRLEEQMKKVEGGDFDINLDVRGEDEVKRLSKTFNLMIARIRQLMEQNVREQEEIRKCEFKALQAQINPHFLYNTLDSIVWMNENHNYEGVTVMVNALARLFRISISRGSEIIGVVDELEHVRSYLIIQQIRYKNKFDFTISAEQEALRHKTLKLILQPIVENAIYHGVANLQEKGVIAINAAVDGATVLFRVRDNGYGIKPELLKDLLNREAKNDHGSGVGLKNVNERVKLTYGSQYGVEIVSELEVGTTVSIRIPLTDLQDGDMNGQNG